MSNTRDNFSLVLDQAQLDNSLSQENAWYAVEFILGKIQRAEY